MKKRPPQQQRRESLSPGVERWEQPNRSRRRQIALAAAGNQLFLCALLTAAALGVAPRRALAIFVSTVKQLRWAILTVCSVLALGYV